MFTLVSKKSTKAAAAAAAAAPSSYITRVVYKRFAGKGQERKQIIAALARRRAPKVYEELQAARIDEHAGAAVKQKDENLVSVKRQREN